jgi:hypothetical protein
VAYVANGSQHRFEVEGMLYSVPVFDQPIPRETKAEIVQSAKQAAELIRSNRINLVPKR